MTNSRSLAGALLLCLLTATAAHAQGEDARVVPRGWLEVRGLGIYSQFDSRFAAAGREELGASFAAGVQSATDRVLGPVLTPLRSNLGTFFTQTASQVEGALTPPEVGSGSVAASLAGDVRSVPLQLGYGLTRRLTVTAAVAVENSKLTVNGLRFTGSSVGVNPNPTGNSAVLTRIDAAYGALGQALLLPTRGSAAGAELQRRVKALADGDSLQLPTRALGVAELAGNAAFSSGLTPEEAAAIGLRSSAAKYGLSDLELGVRLQLLGNPSPRLAGDSAGARGVRSTLALAARLPTGSQGDSTFILALDREVGHAGFSAQLLNDLFLSRRLWATATVGYSQLLAADVNRRPFTASRPFPGDTTLPRTLRRAPGSRFNLALMPRWRLTRELSFAAAYRFEHAGAVTYTARDERGEVELGPIERAEAWTAHSVGFGASFSTYDAFQAGQSRVPVEVGLIYRNTVAGSGFASHAGSVEASVRFRHQLRGRPRRVVPDSAAAPAPAPPAPPPPPSPRAVVAPAERGAPAPAPAPAPPAPVPAPPTPPPTRG